jgi:hypothetical protein
LDRAVRIVVALIGLSLLVCAYLANQRWLDRHFLPAFFASHRTYVLAEFAVRVAMAALGASLMLFARTRILRIPAGVLLADIARIAIAILLAIGASELILRFTLFGGAAEERPTSEEPRRQRDRRLGWTFVPARTGHNTISGRTIEYAFDPAGYRVRSAGQPVDPARPTILFTGESMMVGQGLRWEETIPAQVEALLGTQTANLAVHGYATDQAYLRLQAELPRFRQPVAVVALFTPALFDRNLDADRPHLGPGLIWLPAQHLWSIVELARWLIPYRSDQTINRGVIVTQEVLRATVDLARSRGAVPLIVVPEFGPEQPMEQTLRARILDDARLPYVLVTLDTGWRLRGDLHPDPRAAQAIGTAIASRLRNGAQVVHSTF